ncbi:MAG TPA: hypothetical protein DCY00_03895 [Actinobacteria bacterium]|nr:hypothetical protein [Actinomycetota bacterium]
MKDVEGLYLAGEYLFLIASTEGALATGKKTAEMIISVLKNKGTDCFMKIYKNHIKAPISDMGNVVLNVDHIIACRKFSECCNLSKEEIYNKIIGTSLEDSFKIGKISSNSFCLSVLDRLGVDIPFEDFNLIFSDIFSINNGIPEVIP